MNKFKKYIPIVLLLTPFLALAAQDIFELISLLRYLINLYIIPLVMAVALAVFLWGIIKYITAGGNEEKRVEGRNMMIYGIVGLFVMLAVWGLVWLLLNTFGLNPDYDLHPPYPRF